MQSLDHSMFLSCFFLHSVSIRGADNVGEITLKVVPGEPLNYYWKGHGLRLHIPADALDPSTPPLTMRIQASISGQFRLPDDMDLVSGVYWISFPARVLKQPVTVELQHCAHLEQTEQTYLSFVTSKCNQPLPYQFKPLPGGVFTTSSDHGTVQLYHFSGLAVATKKGRRTPSHSRKQKRDTDDKNASQKVEKKYVALTYYTQATRTTWKMHFTIIPNLDLHLKVCSLITIYKVSGPLPAVLSISIRHLKLISFFLCREWKSTIQKKKQNQVYTCKLSFKWIKLLWTSLRLGSNCPMGGLLSPWHILLV